MHRFLVFLGIWFAGFSLGFVAYLAYPVLADLALTLVASLFNLEGKIAGALLAGFVSSFITLILISIWAHASRPKGI